MEYQILIKELLTKPVIINAQNEKEALKLARQGYRDGRYSLDYENFTAVDYKVVE
jgi:hypothetical protein